MPKYQKPIGGGFSRDVEYYIPKRKSPIVSSSRSTCDSLIFFISQGFNTANKIMEIENTKQFILGQEEKIVCKAYINKGYGDLELNFR